MKTKRSCMTGILAAIVATLVAIPVLYSFLPNDWLLETPRINGAIYTANVGDQTHVYYITREKRNRHMKSGRGGRYMMRFREQPYHVWRIESRSTADFGTRAGEWTNKGDEGPAAQIAAEPTIIGTLPSGLWLWHNGIHLLDPVTLKARFSPDDLTRLNPDLTEHWPDQSRFARVSGDLDGLLIKTMDLRYYRIDPNTGAATPVDMDPIRASMNMASTDDAFNWISAPGRSVGSTATSDFLVSWLTTDDGRWLSLMSREQRQQQGKWPLSFKRPTGEQARELYAVPFTSDDRREVEFDPQAIEQIGDIRLLNSGFLSPDGDSGWKVDDPISYLILSKPDLRQDTPWQLDRITPAGDTIWSTSTSLADIQTLNHGGGTVIFYGHIDHSQPTNNRADTIVLIDQASGTMVSTDVTPAGEPSDRSILSLFTR